MWDQQLKPPLLPQHNLSRCPHPGTTFPILQQARRISVLILRLNSPSQCRPWRIGYHTSSRLSVRIAGRSYSSIGRSRRLRVRSVRIRLRSSRCDWINADHGLLSRRAGDRGGTMVISYSRKARKARKVFSVNLIVVFQQFVRCSTLLVTFYNSALIDQISKVVAHRSQADFEGLCKFFLGGRAALF